MPAASRSRPRSSTWFTARWPAPRSIAMHFSSHDAQPTSGIQRISRFSTQACGGNTTICAIVSQVEVCFHIDHVRALARDVLAADQRSSRGRRRISRATDSCAPRRARSRRARETAASRTARSRTRTPANRGKGSSCRSTTGSTGGPGSCATRGCFQASGSRAFQPGRRDRLAMCRNRRCSAASSASRFARTRTSSAITSTRRRTHRPGRAATRGASAPLRSGAR